uniref:(northern house mosquito) hypothetical protein n=1 Tax=Culex pipiens TaxID=7175 RepID=A0A8D8HIA5_CULPI
MSSTQPTKIPAWPPVPTRTRWYLTSPTPHLRTPMATAKHRPPAQSPWLRPSPSEAQSNIRTLPQRRTQPQRCNHHRRTRPLWLQWAVRVPLVASSALPVGCQTPAPARSSSTTTRRVAGVGSSSWSE